MRFWVCAKCGIVHSEKDAECKCGNSIINPFLRWLSFDSVEKCKEWILMTNNAMGVQLRYGEST